uniref:Uncharacterized protein n=1 Tax=Triticum urartu TaxID=4572 RepID=A0A8R7NXP6_TRIUA
MAPLGVKDQGRAKGPAVWGGAARPATQAADASRGGGETGDKEGAESSWSGREGEVPTAEDGAHGGARMMSRTFSRTDLRSNP